MTAPLREIEHPDDVVQHELRRREAGPAPQLAWLDVASLVVDPAYQRPITRKGRQNIRAIVGEFRWNRFSPVIVSPVEGGRYAIIDGQHRVTAAAAIGIESVPCQIVLANQMEQAEAFGAINGATTAMNSLALHRAAVTAGDPAAVAAENVAARAGIQILAYPVGVLEQQPGQTMAVGAIRSAIARYGADVVVLVLRCIRETRNNVRGGVLAPIVTAASAVVSEIRADRRSDADIVTFFDTVLLIREADKARIGERSAGEPIHAALADRLRAAWRRHAGEA